MKRIIANALLALTLLSATAVQAATLFSDDYNRADGAPGANYTQAGGGADYTIVTNELNCVCSGNQSLAVTSIADVANVKVTFKRASGAGYDAGVHVRSSFGGATSNTGSGYVLNASGTTIEIIRRIGGANTIVGSKAGLTLADNDVIAVEISGTGATVTFRIFLNTVEQTPALTDTSGSRITTAGKVGFYVFNAGSMHDDLLVEDVAAPAGNLLLRRRRAANDDHFERPLKVAAGF